MNIQAPIHLTASIVTYNSDVDLLKRCIESLLHTIPKHVHCYLFIVDNHSTTDYTTLLESYQGENFMFMPLSENLGFGKAHNKVISTLGKSDYHLILNPDVKLHEGALSTLIEHLETNKDVGLVAPKLLYEDGRTQHLNKRTPTVLDLFMRRFLPKCLRAIPLFKRRIEHYTMQDIGYEHSYQTPHLSGCCMLFRTSLLRELKGFDEQFFLYMEDTDLSMRAAQHARTVFLPTATITHTWYRGAHRDFKLMLKMMHSCWIFFRIWGWRFF